MKRSNPKKKVILSIIAIAGLALSSITLAGTAASSKVSFTASPPTNGGGSDNSCFIAAIKTVGNKMVALAFSGATVIDNAIFQYDPNLLTILNANTAATTISAAKAKSAGTATNAFVQDQFQSIPNQILPTNEGMMNAKIIQDQRNKQSKVISSLTTDVPASDTLYSNNPLVIQSQYTNGSNYYIGPPNINDDSYFNFSTLFSPKAYTTDEQTAVNDYIQYLTQSYNTPSTALNLSILESDLNAMKPKDQYNTLYNIISGQSKLGAAYQQYQLAMRSNMASESIALSNLNYLIAERAPSKTKVSGIADSQGKAISKPSSLQVKAYQANNRIDNPDWIKGLQKQSSATLQRETVVLLAQIAHQNYQAHLDRERIIASLSAMELQGNAANQILLITKAQAVNTAIGELGKSNASSDSSSLSNPNS